MRIFDFFTKPARPVESMVVVLHRMDTKELKALEPKWVKMFGAQSGQVKRLRTIVASREGA